MAAPQASTFDRLSSTLFIAALAHGLLILGVTFTGMPAPESAELPSLNVTLVVDSASADDEADDDSRFLADRTLEGRSSAEDGERPTTTLAAEHPRTQPGDPRGADLRDGAPHDPAHVPERVTSRSNTDQDTQARPETTEETADAPMKAAALIRQTAPRTLAAELDERATQPAAEAEAEQAAPSTRESAVAAYQVRWRQRVERIGTANFPAGFLERNPSLDRPTLEVAIDREGRIEEIVVQHSSGDRSLDQAALDILRLAAPFEPLPEAITADSDVLRFAYEWDFSAAH